MKNNGDNSLFDLSMNYYYYSRYIHTNYTLMISRESDAFLKINLQDILRIRERKYLCKTINLKENKKKNQNTPHQKKTPARIVPSGNGPMTFQKLVSRFIKGPTPNSSTESLRIMVWTIPQNVSSNLASTGKHQDLLFS